MRHDMLFRRGALELKHSLSGRVAITTPSCSVAGMITELFKQISFAKIDSPQQIIGVSLSENHLIHAANSKFYILI